MAVAVAAAAAEPAGGVFVGQVMTDWNIVARPFLPSGQLCKQQTELVVVAARRLALGTALVAGRSAELDVGAEVDIKVVEFGCSSTGDSWKPL
jgi:hypothetical protein